MKLWIWASVLTVGFCHLLGGWTVQDPTDPHWPEMLALEERRDHIKVPNGFTLKAVQTKFEVGYFWKFTFENSGVTCDMVFYEAPWTPTNVTQNTCKAYLAKQARRMLLAVPDGYIDQDPNDSLWTTVLEDLEYEYHLIVRGGAKNNVQIVGVATQIDAGTKYKFTLTVNGKVCQIVYFDQPWTNTREIIQDDCGMKAMAKSKRSSTSVAQHKCLGAILDRINRMSNSSFRLVDSHNIQTHIQRTNKVVSGDFRIRLSESACINGPDTAGYTSTECPVNPLSRMHTTWEVKCKYSADGMPIEVSDLQMV